MGDPRELEIKSLKIALKDYGIEPIFMEQNYPEMNGGGGDGSTAAENGALEHSGGGSDLKRIVGGDVLFTGYEFFIGISYFTNIEGAMEFAAKMTDLAVTIVNLPLETSSDPEM